MDINAGGFDTPPTGDQVAAGKAHFLKAPELSRPHSYDSDYLENRQYDEAINHF